MSRGGSASRHKARYAVERDHLRTIVGRDVRPCKKLVHHLILLGGEVTSFAFAIITSVSGLSKFRTAFIGQRNRGMTNGL